MLRVRFMFYPRTSHVRMARSFGARGPRSTTQGGCFILAQCLVVGLLLTSCATKHRPADDNAPSKAVAPTTMPSSAEDAGRPVAATLLETGTSAADEPIRYPASALPWVTAQVVTIAPGQVTGWHRHGVPTFGRMLSGELEVEYASGERRTLRAGDSLMEAMRVAHNGVNLGAENVRILVVYMGAQGVPTTMQSDPPPMPERLGSGKPSHLVELGSAEPLVRLDLRYATANNFTGRVVYPSARAFLQKPAAEALLRVGKRAQAQGYGLLVLDAYRPWSATRMFWDSYPMHRAYLADPLNGSRHNRGCAVDLTLFDLATGTEVGMPSGYDDFSERAHPGFPGGTEAQRTARDTLRAIMEAEEFSVYENEWWHFDYRGWEEYPVLDLRLDQLPAARP